MTGSKSRDRGEKVEKGEKGLVPVAMNLRGRKAGLGLKRLKRVKSPQAHTDSGKFHPFTDYSAFSPQAHLNDQAFFRGLTRAGGAQ